MRAPILLLACLPVFGADSVHFTATKSATVAYGGFTNVKSIRIEGRIHGRPAPSSVDAYAFQLGNTQNSLKISSTGGSLNDRVWCIVQNNTQISGSPTPTDFEFRWQRTAAGARICEVWSLDAVGAPVFYSNSIAVTPTAVASGNITIGGSGIAFDLAYLKIFEDSPVAIGSNPPGTSATVGNYAHYAFEGTTPTQLGQDSSGNSRNLTWNGGDPTTVTTPTITPDCDAGTSDSFRAGDPLTATGTASSGFNGFPLSYRWVVTESPAAGPQLEFQDNIATASTVTLNNTVAGQYTFQLTVSDTVASAQCSVSHGVVPYTNKGLVLVDTSTTEKGKFHELLGPVVAMPYLESLWPYAAFTIKTMEEFFRSQTSDSFQPFWNDPAELEAGTLSISGTSITGTGTTLKTTFCGGTNTRNAFTGNNPAFIYIRYPATNDTGYNWTSVILAPPFDNLNIPVLPHASYPVGNQYYNTTSGKLFKNVGGVWTEQVGKTTCDSETAAEMHAPFAPADGVPPYTGMVFFQDNAANSRGSGWLHTESGASSTNFYDVAKAGYAVHVSTGLTAPLARARVVAESWIQSPYAGRMGLFPRSPRDQALTGIGMRYLEDTSQTWLLQALHNAWDRMEAVSATWSAERESFYAQMHLAECAYIDPTHCTAEDVSDLYDDTFVALQCKLGARDCGVNYNHNQIAGAVPAVFGALGASFSGGYLNKFINATQGSDIITLQGGATWPTTFWNWASNAKLALWIKTDGQNNLSTNAPGYGWQNEQVSGTLGTIQYVSPTTARLPEPWPFADCTNCPWLYSPYPGIYDTQPFMMGIAGQTAHRILKVTGNTEAERQITEFADWIRDYGYMPTNKGLYYMRGALNCETHSNGDPINCSSGVSTDRFLGPEALQLLSRAWLQDQDATHKTLADTLMGATFSSTAYCGVNCGPETDSQFVGDIIYPTGQTFTATKAKDFGIMAGVGGAMIWPAVRELTEWPRTPPTQVHKIAFRLADIATANGVRITLRNQFGTVLGSPTDCATSPCSVTIPDGEAGNYMFTIQYRNGSTALATSMWQKLPN